MRKCIIAVLLIAAAVGGLRWANRSTIGQVMPVGIQQELYGPLNELVLETWATMDSRPGYPSREQLDKMRGVLREAEHAINRFEDGKRMPRTAL